jgi:hypothetical protein
MNDKWKAVREATRAQREKGTPECVICGAGTYGKHHQFRRAARRTLIRRRIGEQRARHAEVGKTAFDVC